MAVKGVDILIMVKNSEEEGEFICVGGQRNATFSETNEPIETTHKMSGGFKEFEYGFGEWTVSGDGVYIKNDEGYTTLVNAMRNKEKVKLRVQEEGTSVLEGLALLTSRDLESGFEGEATYAIEFQGSGALEEV
ncbi:phage tail tube protein [Jeotgalibacillus marinus]|uniref:Phage tail tube protein n=1 Tax=Jeotgalibacillus marinus TaxID=86667 RepID=A0ABV3Q8M7_9BACL